MARFVNGGTAEIDTHAAGDDRLEDFFGSTESAVNAYRHKTF
jgi:hypothetical protein